ncbi:MAG: hypothetical protein HN945_07590 [Deltaproteobacteria bacterium]|nr:hypothetical protein [Deltaproteobacteria bacterium]
MSEYSQNKSARYEPRTATTPGGCGYVELWETEGDQTGSLVWKFMPRNNNPVLILVRVIEGKHMLTVDETARVGVYDIAGRNEIASKEFYSQMPAGAVLDQNESLLLVALDPVHDSSRFLLMIDIRTLEIRNRLQLPDKILLTSLQVINNEEVVFYFPTGSIDGRDVRDGLLRVDVRYNRRLSQYFSSSPTGRFSVPPMAVCPDRNVGIRPCYERIDIIRESGEKRYLAKAILFDLNTCKVIRKITLRQFHPGQLFEDDDPDTALSYLESPAASEEQIEVRDEFLERIDAFAFCHTEGAFWVTFQHGTIRKISLEGDYLSPLIAHPGDPSCSTDDPFYRTGFDNPVSISNDDRYLTFGVPSITIDLSKIDLQSGSDLLILLPAEILIPFAYTGLESEKEFSWTIVGLDNPEDEISVQTALEQLVHLTENIDEIRDGNLLRFRFHSREGDLSEEAFFKIAGTITECLPAMSRFVQNLCNHVAPLWYDTELPAGFYAMQSLVFSDEKYLKLLINYLGSAVDGKYEGNAISHLVNDAINRYNFNHDIVGVLLTFAVFQPEPGLDMLQQQAQSQMFLKFSEVPGNLSYFRNHTLFKSLLEDYFHLLLPGEDTLFEAIEAEDKDRVREILQDDIDLNIIHPDFECSALELAFELENPDIIRLLIEHGADIERLNIDNLAKIILQRSTPLSPEESRNINSALDILNGRKEAVQDQISKIEYQNMLSFTVSVTQLAEMKEAQGRLEELNRELRFARLGIDKTGRYPLVIIPARDNTPQEYRVVDSEPSRELIRDSAYFEEDLKAATVVIGSLDDESDLIDAFEQLIDRSHKLEELIVDDRLRFSFKDSQRVMNEKQFYESLILTPGKAEKLAEFLKNVVDNAPGELWYDDDTQACMYALQALVLFDRQYIGLFIRYLKSGIINPDHEKLFPTELVFNAVAQYGWCNDTLELLAVRTIVCGSRYAMDELRIQLKKGGLKEFLQDSEQFDYFLQYLQKEAGKRETEEIKTICDLISRLPPQNIIDS